MIDLSNYNDKQLATLDFKEALPKPKHTTWKHEPNLLTLKQELSQAKSHQDKYIQKINEWQKLYDAPKFNSKTKGSRITPKLVRKQAEWNAPALSEPFLSTSNLFDVRPLTFEDVTRAKQNALILNRQFNVELNKTKLVDKIIRTLVKDGTCLLRTGWEYVEKEVIEQIEQFEFSQVLDEQLVQGLMQQYQELGQLRQTEPDSYENLPIELKAGFEMSEQTGQLITAKIIGFKPQKVTKAVVNKPTVEICNLKNVYIDPTCQDDLDKAQFIIHAYESSYAQLKKQGQYHNLDKLVATDNHELDNASEFKFADKARQKIVVYEYWGYWDIDGTGETKPIVVSWVGDTIIRMENNPFPDGKLPFVVFNFLPSHDSIYGEPNAELLSDNQAILGAVTRGMIDLLGKSANSQTGYMKNFLDPTNKRKFLAGEDYEFNHSTDPRIHVHTHKYPEIPNSAMAIVQMMNNDAESLSGVKAFSGTGISASNLGDVAVGVRGVLDAVSKREMSILRRISDGFIRLGRKIMSMNSQWLSEQEVVRITNHEFVKIKRDDLAGEFDLVLTISTAEGDDAKAKELAFMLQTMGNSLGQEIVQMILSEIATLRKMPELAKAILNYQPQPDEFSQAMQELELEYKKAEIELMKAEAQERMAKSQVQEAKVGVENARAESLQGDADKKALDFVEKDSGLAHQQALDKQALINEGLTQREQLKADSHLASQQAKAQQNMVDNLLNNALQEQSHQAYQERGLNL